MYRQMLRFLRVRGYTPVGVRILVLIIIICMCVLMLRLGYSLPVVSAVVGVAVTAAIQLCGALTITPDQSGSGDVGQS